MDYTGGKLNSPDGENNRKRLFRTDEEQIEMSSSDENFKRPRLFSTTSSTASIIKPATFSFANAHIGTTRWSPYNTLMLNYQTRLKSFDTWPKQLVQRPKELAQSGLYYTGHGDLTRCFFCNIPIFHWERIDDINLEHKRHSPYCKYLEMACDI